MAREEPHAPPAALVLCHEIFDALGPCEQLLVSAFFDLSPSRAPAFGATPCSLPVSEIRDYYEWVGPKRVFSPAEFLRWMRTLDGIYIKFRKDNAPTPDAMPEKPGDAAD